MRFGFEGTDYEIDLSTTNAGAFRNKLAPFIAQSARRPAVRHAGWRGHRLAGSAAAKSGPGPTTHGITVNARGRIPASFFEQYRAATGQGH